MRIAGLLAFLVGSLLMAQENNPGIKRVPVSPTAANSGKEMFGAYCASCHGLTAKGDGAAAVALKVPPADLTQLARKNGGKFPAIRVTASIQDVGENAHGSKEMPVWGPVLASVSGNDSGVVKLRIANLTSYIESLQAK